MRDVIKITKEDLRLLGYKELYFLADLYMLANERSYSDLPCMEFKASDVDCGIDASHPTILSLAEKGYLSIDGDQIRLLRYDQLHETTEQVNNYRKYNAAKHRRARARAKRIEG